MTAFLVSLAILIGGYFIYGYIVERVIGIDPARTTPAYTLRDDIDFVPMPTWKVFLIQFLNIAGLGPIFGAIMGIMFGPAAFLWIVFGTIFAGAVHDFVSAMISMRSGGISLPEIVGNELGSTIKNVMRGFSLLLLILVGTVFVVSPAQLIAGMTPAWNSSVSRKICPSVMEMTLVGMYADTSPAWVSMMGSAVKEPPPFSLESLAARSSRRECR